ncbi:MAG TPA: hypothetical protein VFZ28_00965 [Burkholderiaceae bacterium]|nr:hypothetical protein [Burkholderiaceae bacterium]
MTTPLSHALGPLDRHRAAQPPTGMSRRLAARLAGLLTRVRHAWHHEGGTGAAFECVDTGPLAPDDLRASGSMGLDMAPSMVFSNTMPTYARHIDRPASLARRPSEPKT